jgi:pyruvate ferredoxin oxidoreductase alpha subunit
MLKRSWPVYQKRENKLFLHIEEAKMTVVAQATTLTGNEAVTWAMKLARVNVGVFFPIGPADEVMETLRIRIDEGEMPDARVIQLENEKAVVSCQIGLARMGIRSLFATCTEGLLWPAAEIRYAAGSRLPIMIAIASRAIEPPTSVYADHEDFIMMRDMGWLMFYCEDSQDIIDTVIQAYKISEHKSILLPAFVGYEGWEISHGKSRVTLPEQEKVDAFLTPYPMRLEGDYASIDWYERCKNRGGYGWAKLDDEHSMEAKFFQAKALEDATRLIEEVGREYRELFGSRHVGFLEAEGCEDAEVIVVTMGALAPLVRWTANAYKEKGIKIGSIKLRVFRPFPERALCEAVKKAKVVIVLERNLRNVVYTELKSALYTYFIAEKKGIAPPVVMGRIVGLGGRWVSPADITHIIDEGLKALETGKTDKSLEWVSLEDMTFDPLRDFVFD